MSNHLEFNQMVDIDIRKYENMLDNFYIQKLLNIQFLLGDIALVDKELEVVNDWYKKEKWKCQNAKK